MKWKLFSLLLSLFVLQSCMIKDVETPKNQYVIVYTDLYTKQDKLNFKKFQKEKHIQVCVKLISADTLKNFLQSEKFNAGADLIILKEFTKLVNLSTQHLLLPIYSNKLEENIDPLYRSKYNKWFALSKTPLVIAYHSKVLKKDTIRSYYDLTDSKWQGKMAIQRTEDPTQITFKRNVRYIFGSRADTFLYRFYKQSSFPVLENDKAVLQKINKFEAELGIVKLSSLVDYELEEITLHPKTPFYLNANFPNQRKKGCYFTITASGVYRYAKNPLQAKELLEFLASRKAQYAFAEGRLEFPVLKGVKAHYLLESYGKFRGRFYKEKF